jgi:steroid 5-alpha reductase family enzyme
MQKNFNSLITIIIPISLIILGLYFTEFNLSKLQSDSLFILLVICFVSIAYCFIAGEVTGNNSQMDKLWSILPIIYAWVTTYQSGFNIRLIVMATLITFWGIRLTYNFAKKGAYSIKFWQGEEDYRWLVLRQNPIFNKRWKWMLFDLFFISAYQNLLVLAITLPMVAVMETSGFTYLDGLVAILMLGFIIFELIADKQQMEFQTEKYALLNKGKKLEELPYPYNKGFIAQGLWSRSRHPNYFAEQSIWVVLYLFTFSSGIATLGHYWTVIGSMLLILLFTGSSKFSEGISKKKYPEYKFYIQQVHKYMPLKKYNDSQLTK